MKQRNILVRGAFALLLGSGCAHPQPPPAPSEPPVLVFENVRYDGHTVAGRALIGARGNTQVDRRLIENVSLGVDRVTDCATGATFPTLVADTLPEPATREDLLTLREGEWFGKDVAFLVFAEPFSPPEGPACIELTLSLHLARPVTLRFKAERSSEALDPGLGGVRMRALALPFDEAKTLPRRLFETLPCELGQQGPGGEWVLSVRQSVTVRPANKTLTAFISQSLSLPGGLEFERAVGIPQTGSATRPSRPGVHARCHERRLELSVEGAPVLTLLPTLSQDTVSWRVAPDVEARLQPLLARTDPESRRALDEFSRLVDQLEAHARSSLRQPPPTVEGLACVRAALAGAPCTRP